jgi:isochorismate synthase EntC
LPGDARSIAVSILQQIDTAPAQSPFLCYGTAAATVLAFGRKHSICLDGRTNLDDTWAGIDGFLQEHSDDYVVGFIGFDPSNELGCEVATPRQKIDLFVPKTVIECSAAGHMVTSGDFQTHTPRGYAMPPQAGILDPADFDCLRGKDTYAQSVAEIIELIHSGSLERVTLARRIDVDRTLDLAATFLSDGSRHECARNFHFGNECIRFAGQSPELLAEGSRHCFHTHKLSGTYRNTDELPVAELTRLFRADRRIEAEHYSSIAAIEKSLQMLGLVEATRFQVMELPGLLHGWSKFITRPSAQQHIANCLRAVFPYGMQPLQVGLELVRRHERFLRGPYYGLVGYIKPDGEFSFTQVLRAAFADGSSNYLMAGAAITRHSTPELEVAETCTKLSAIRVFEKTRAAVQSRSVY